MAGDRYLVISSSVLQVRVELMIKKSETTPRKMLSQRKRISPLVLKSSDSFLLPSHKGI
jgi:hypothetical protein